MSSECSVAAQLCANCIEIGVEIVNELLLIAYLQKFFIKSNCELKANIKEGF
jgi:hypothetical protein